MSVERARFNGAKQGSELEASRQSIDNFMFQVRIPDTQQG